jgi:hypothetical protein
VKIAVVAPIPIASVSAAVTANPGAFRNCRKANLKSLIIIVTVPVTTLLLLANQLAAKS